MWLVDDDKAFGELSRELLERESNLHCPHHFESPGSAIEALRCQPAPDVLLLDIHMGSANGLDAIIPIRAVAPQTRVLMFTTFSDSLAESRALRDGAMGFLLKTDSF